MSKLFSRKWLLVILAAALFVMAGCQAVSGVDFNRVLKQSMQVTSSESKQVLEFQMELKEDELEDLEDSERAVVQLLSHIKVELDSVKVADLNHMSLDGKVTFNQKQSVEFAVQVAENIIGVTIEGAKHPFIFDLSDSWDLEDDEYYDNPLDEVALIETATKMTETVGGFLIERLPNPKSLKVSPTFETINGVSTSLIHASVELDGKEVWSLMLQYFDTLLDDEEGIQKMVSEVLTILLENEDVAQEYLYDFDSGVLDAPTKEDLVKEGTEEFIYTLQELKSNLKGSPMGIVLRETIAEALTVKADIYVDSNLNIRKQQFDVSFNIENDEALAFLPFRNITLKSSSEVWNVNEKVVADKPVTKNSIEADQLSDMEGYEIVKLFDENSFIYDLLKNKFHITQQQYVAYNFDYYDGYNAPIIVPGYITIVAVRDVADEFGAETKYDAKTKTITIHDFATDTIIKTQVGSDIAYINGKEVKWSYPTTIINGSAYVAARSLSEALQATIEWTKLYEDIKFLTIEREL